MTLSSHARIGAYDCLYVVLADDEQCKVVTADKKLLGTFKATTIDLASI